MKYIYLLMCYLLIWPVAFAYSEDAIGIGGVAHHIMGPVSLFSDFIYTACFILGGSFLFAGVIKYIDHRRSPLQIPLSTVVFLFFAGLLFLLIPFAYLLIEHATPYSLMRR